MSRHYLIVTLDGSGNQMPIIGVAQQLQQHASQVTVAGYASQTKLFEQSKLKFTVLPKSEQHFASQTAMDFSRVAMGIFFSPVITDEVITLYHDVKATHLIIDCLLFSLILNVSAQHSELLPNTYILIHSTPNSVCAVGGMLDQFCLTPVNQIRQQFNQTPLSTVSQVWTQAGVPEKHLLVCSIPELNPNNSDNDKVYNYIGARIPASVSPANWSSNLPYSLESNNVPLILLSFHGTPMLNQQTRIQRSLDALSDGKKYRVLCTTSYISPSTLQIPSNAYCTEQVISHTDILPYTSAVITHGGHGTIITALKYGVPMIFLPNQMADQPILSAMIQHELHAGISLDGENATVEQIADAVNKVVTDHTYKQNAQKLQVQVNQLSDQPLSF